MSPDSSKRFTDREVALILRKASEFDEATGAGPGTGLSRRDLEEIAVEVGISVESITRAIDQVGTEDSRGWSLALAPLAHRAVHAVDGELNDAVLRRLIQVVDGRAATPGAGSEALGSSRWTGSDRFRSTQVAITPGDGETSIQVTEKATGRLARVTHFVPGALGMMLATSMGAAVDPSAAVALGLAAALTSEARDSVEEGQMVPLTLPIAED